MTEQPTNLLHLVELFSDLDVAETNRIGTLCEWRRADKHTVLIDEDDPTHDVFFIVEGRVCAKSYSKQGKEVAYIEIERGGTFGEFSAIDRQTRASSIETLEDSYVARMSADRFRGLIAENGSIGLRLAEILVRKNRELSKRMFEFSTMTVNHRVGAELLRMARDVDSKSNHVTVESAPSHQELASRLSTHREAVSRVISDLSSRGILKPGRRKLEVLDVAALDRSLHIELK